VDLTGMQMESGESAGHLMHRQQGAVSDRISEFMLAVPAIDFGRSAQNAMRSCFGWLEYTA